MVYYPYDTIENVAIAVFDDGAPVPVKQLELSITPVQDLHGQANPYPSGGGKNKIKLTIDEIKAANSTRTWVGKSTTFSGITYEIITDNADNVIGINASGTATANADLSIPYESITNNMILNGCPTDGSTNTYRITATGEGNDVGNGVNISSEFVSGIYIRIYSGYEIDGHLTFRPMLRVATDTDATFAPYSNICPISGFTSAEITVENAEVDPEIVEEYEIEFPEAAGTVYGGTLKYTGGGKYLLTVDKGYKDLGTCDWGYDNGVFFSPSISGAKKASGVTSICTAYLAVANVNGATEAQSNPNLSVSLMSNPGGADRVYLINNSKTGADLSGGVASWLVGVNLVYELAMPLTYEITAEAVETLYKNNVIFANTGNIIKLEYRLNQLDYYRRLEMYNFGYIMMDGGGIDLSSSDPQTITGAWARTVTAIKTGKPIFAYNTKYGTGKNLTPVPCFAWYINSTTAVIVGATLHIQVTSDDTCVVQDVAPSVNRALTMSIDELAEKAVDVDELKTTKAKAKK